MVAITEHRPVIASSLNLSRTNASAMVVGIDSPTPLSPTAALNMIRPLKTGFDALKALDETKFGAAGLRAQPLVTLPKKSPLITLGDGPTTSHLASIPQITSGWQRS